MKVAIQFEKGKPKALKIDGQEPEKLSDVIGKVPLVLILPDDTSMIKEGGEERRKFFDGALSQFDHEYLLSLLKYSKLLKQRNSLLKQGSERGIDKKLLDTYDEQIIPLALMISNRRKELALTFLPFLEKTIKIFMRSWKSQVWCSKRMYLKILKCSSRPTCKKIRLCSERCLAPIEMTLNFYLMMSLSKKFGSQGQQKTFIISLKLALFDFLSDRTGDTPLLLLDDIFDKLDDTRIQKLVSLLEERSRFQQIFITDARKDRSKVLFGKDKSVNFIEL